MFSKFDTTIQCEETTYTPTAADWAEYHKWLEAVEAATLAQDVRREYEGRQAFAHMAHADPDYWD